MTIDGVQAAIIPSRNASGIVIFWPRQRLNENRFGYCGISVATTLKVHAATF
jgi:hypothetical protein